MGAALSGVLHCCGAAQWFGARAWWSGAAARAQVVAGLVVWSSGQWLEAALSAVLHCCEAAQWFGARAWWFGAAGSGLERRAAVYWTAVEQLSGLWQRSVVCVTAVELLSSLEQRTACLLYTSPSPRDRTRSRMPSSA